MTLDWVEHAKCRGIAAKVFFPVGLPHNAANTASITFAKRVCAACPVQSQCLQYAIDNNEEYGIWGGLMPHERSNTKAHRVSIRKARRKAEQSSFPPQRRHLNGRWRAS